MIVKVFLVLISWGAYHGMASSTQVIEIPEGIEMCKALAPIIAERIATMQNEGDTGFPAFRVTYGCTTIPLPDHQQRTEGK